MSIHAPVLTVLDLVVDEQTEALVKVERLVYLVMTSICWHVVSGQPARPIDLQ